MKRCKSIDLRGFHPPWGLLFHLVFSFKTMSSYFPWLGFHFLHHALGHTFWVWICLHFCTLLWVTPSGCGYVYIPVLCVETCCACFILQVCIMHFEWWKFVIRWQSLSNHGWFLTLEYGYALKSYVVGVYSCFIGCMIHHMCNCPYPCQLVTYGFAMYMTCTICLVLKCALACLRLNILLHAVYINMKPCRCNVAHLTGNFAIFSLWK